MNEVLEDDQLFHYQYQGYGNVDIQPSGYLLSLTKQEQREKLLNAIEAYHNEMAEIKDMVVKARFMLFVEFAQHLLSTQESWAK